MSYADKRFFPLFSQYDIHEYSIMERFIRDLSNERVQEGLASAIRGKGDFRRFKDRLYQYGLEQTREKRYFESLSHYQGNLLFVGVNYDEKEKTHACRIETFKKN